MSKDNTKLPLKRALTQDKMTAHHAKAFLVTCMDLRFINDEVNHMQDKGYDVQLRRQQSCRIPQESQTHDRLFNIDS